MLLIFFKVRLLMFICNLIVILVLIIILVLMVLNYDIRKDYFRAWNNISDGNLWRALSRLLILLINYSITSLLLNSWWWSCCCSYTQEFLSDFITIALGKAPSRLSRWLREIKVASLLISNLCGLFWDVLRLLWYNIFSRSNCFKITFNGSNIIIIITLTFVKVKLLCWFTVEVLLFVWVGNLLWKSRTV